MLANDCITPIPASTNVFISGAPYTITAFEKNPYGYSESFCYSCEIQPFGQTPIKFDQQITVVADPVDCSNTLIDHGLFINPPPDIPFNSVGASVGITAAYTSIFTHFE